MRDRLLSELFPNFVKKEYLQSRRLSQGPFGEGLEKARTYLKPGQEAPQGARVQTGAKGGRYYEDTGGGGAAVGSDDQAPQQTYEAVPEDMADRQQAAVDEMQQINQQRMAEYQDAQAAGPEALADWQAGEAERQEGVAAARADIEGLRDARAQGPEAEEAYKDKRKQEESAKYQELVAQVQADLPNKVIEDGPLKGMTYGEADKQLKEFADKVDMEVGANREKVDKLTEILSGQTKEERQKGVDAARADIEARRAQNEAEAAGQPPPPDASPPDVSEATFDGQGNIQTPGSDPYPVSEMISEGTDSESLSQVIDAYQNESGGKQSVPPIISEGYSGPLNRDSFEDHISNNQYEDFYITDNDYEDALGFFDWLESKAGTGVDEAGQTSPPDVSESSSASETTAEAVRRSEFASENNPQYSVYSNKYNADKAMEGVEDHLMDQGVSNDPHDIQGVLDEYADFWGIPQGESRNQLYDAGQQFMVDRAQDSAEQMTDYQMMAKMMQKYNVDNERRDPVILSNKGGRQRR